MAETYIPYSTSVEVLGEDEERLTAEFNADSVLELTPELVGPSVTRNEAIIGEGVDLNLVHTGDLRRSTLRPIIKRSPKRCAT